MYRRQWAVSLPHTGIGKLGSSQHYGHRPNPNWHLILQIFSWNTITQFSYGLMSKKIRLIKQSSCALFNVCPFLTQNTIWKFYFQNSHLVILGFAIDTYNSISLTLDESLMVKTPGTYLDVHLVKVIIYACLKAQLQALCLRQNLSLYL